MTWNQLKKGIAGTALMFTFLLGGGAIFGTTAQAQNRDRNWQRDRNDCHDRDRDWERRQQAERAREWEWRQERERLRNRPVYGYPAPRVYPYGGYGRNGGYSNGGYSNGGYSNGGYSSYDEQKGFHDGLDRGQEDARDRRSFNPNNSEHFRNGNSAYRAGFRRGYEQGYSQYGGYRRW